MRRIRACDPCTRAGRAARAPPAGSFGSSPSRSAGLLPGRVRRSRLPAPALEPRRPARRPARGDGSPCSCTASKPGSPSARWSAGRSGARTSSWRTPSTPRDAFARRTRDSPGGRSPSVISAWARPTPPVRFGRRRAASRARSPSSSGDWPARSATRGMTCSSICGRGSGTRCPTRTSSWRETATTARASRPGPPRSAATCGSSGACPIEALAALYRDCAFFVMPSRDEGFGLVFLEAMRAGKACIGGAGAAAEVIEDGVTGLVVDAADRQQVAKAVVRLFLEPDDAGAHGTGGGRARRAPVHRGALSPALPRRPRARRAVTAVLGICAYHGDAAAALVVDGRLEAAVEEERFARVKHWAGFPRESIRSCLDMAGMTPADVDHFAIGRNPRANLWRKARFALAHRPSLAPRLGPRAERPPRAARGSGPRGRPRPRPRARRRAPALGRAPSGASRQRLSRLALRRGGRLRDRRLRRLRQHVVGHRPRRIDRRARSRLLPPLARPPLSRDHPVPRVHDLRRRVQGDGPRAVRRARLRRRALARPASPARGAASSSTSRTFATGRAASA